MHENTILHWRLEVQRRSFPGREHKCSHVEMEIAREWAVLAQFCVILVALHHFSTCFCEMPGR